MATRNSRLLQIRINSSKDVRLVERKYPKLHQMRKSLPVIFFMSHCLEAHDFFLPNFPSLAYCPFADFKVENPFKRSCKQHDCELSKMRWNVFRFWFWNIRKPPVHVFLGKLIIGGDFFIVFAKQRKRGNAIYISQAEYHL